MNASIERLDRHRSALLVVDLQQRLLDVMRDPARIVWNARRVLEAANLFSVPIAASEQYPERLGETAASLQPLLPTPNAKRSFSVLPCDELLETWRADSRSQIVVIGIETHVCVLQTVLDLLAEGFQTHVVVDATSSRSQSDQDIALRRMSDAGATLTTVEMALFEWCADSRDPQFKQISALVRETPPGE
ncbi:MAG: hydrolase [Planctomycetales bacterium]|nr:hydrolase [Planctomycetales bacterium]